MAQSTKNNTETSSKATEGFLSNFLISVLSKLLALPLFILAYRVIPSMHWPYLADRIILFIVIIIFTYMIMKFFKIIILPAFLLTIVFLTYGTIQHKYGFKNLYKDYENIFYSALYDPVPKKLTLNNYIPFPNERPIRKAINYTSPIVRNFSLAAINKHFKEQQQHSPYRTIIQCFAIFKEINTKWNYVNDPKSRDYYAKASESIKYLSGDCDDHSTLMAACVKSVGGTPRLILTTKHIYPELLVGNRKDLKKIDSLIHYKLFNEESKGKQLNYHYDPDGKIWINLDYTEKYPGGEFLSEKVLGILNI